MTRPGNPSLLHDSGAQFDETRAYRYRLWRRWDPARAKLVMVMLNPSTADDVNNDPTVERCARRALQLGFGQIEVVNLFALRSTDPPALHELEVDPIGPDNDAAIMTSVADAGMVLCGWGDHGDLLGRGRAVIRMLRGAGVRLHALRMTKKGHPGHPLYIGYDVRPFELTAY